MDSAEANVEDVMKLYADDAVLHSAREGVIRGEQAIEQFYRNNADFFTGGKHHMTDFREAGDVVICEGYLDGETSVGRASSGVPLCDIILFEAGKIAAFRAYMDYRGFVAELPEEVPNVRAEALQESGSD